MPTPSNWHQTRIDSATSGRSERAGLDRSSPTISVSRRHMVGTRERRPSHVNWPGASPRHVERGGLTRGALRPPVTPRVAASVSARRSTGAASGTPAPFAAMAVRRRLAVRRSAIAANRSPAILARFGADCLGVEGAEPLVSLLVATRGMLTHLSGVRQALRRRVRDASSAAANTVAARHRNRSGEPVQTVLRKRGQRWDGGQRCRAMHVPPKPERRPIPPASLSRGTGTGSAVGWINLTTCVSSGVSPRLTALPFTLR